MHDPPRQDKPYRVYRAGDRRPDGRVRRTLVWALLGVGIVVAAVAVAVGDWRPSASGAAPAPGTSLPTNAALSPAATPSPQPSPPAGSTPSPTPGFSVTAGGDVIGGFAVGDVVASVGSRLFAHVAPVFARSDFGFVNLESPLTRGGDAQSWKDVVIKGDPDLAPAMAASGIDVVTMANNHAGDMGDSGLLDSIRHCRKNDIAVVGAGKDLDEAMSSTVLTTADGTKVAFLGFTDVLPAGYPATASSPGVAPGRADIGAVKRAVRRAARRADFVVVGWHWNFEYKRAPSSLELSEGHAVVDAGADIVFAHHPHLLNGVEKYGSGLIFYSLGNLVFSGFDGETAETLLVRARVSKERIEAQLVPVIGGGTGVPYLARGPQAQSILRRVKGFSAALDTDVKIAGGKGYVLLRR